MKKGKYLNVRGKHPDERRHINDELSSNEEPVAVGKIPRKLPRIALAIMTEDPERPDITSLFTYATPHPPSITGSPDNPAVFEVRSYPLNHPTSVIHLQISPNTNNHDATEPVYDNGWDPESIKGAKNIASMCFGFGKESLKALGKELKETEHHRDYILSFINSLCGDATPTSYFKISDKPTRQTYFVDKEILPYLQKRFEGDINLADPLELTLAIEDNPNIVLERMFLGSIVVATLDKMISGRGLDLHSLEGEYKPNPADPIAAYSPEDQLMLGPSNTLHITKQDWRVEERPPREG